MIHLTTKNLNGHSLKECNVENRWWSTNVKQQRNRKRCSVRSDGYVFSCHNIHKELTKAMCLHILRKKPDMNSHSSQEKCVQCYHFDFCLLWFDQSLARLKTMLSDGPNSLFLLHSPLSDLFLLWIGLPSRLPDNICFKTGAKFVKWLAVV